MKMTEGEILREYRLAKNKKRQITILAQQNLCSEEEIKLIVSGASVKSSPIVDKLYQKLDSIDKKIKELEEEYKKVKAAIDVVGEMEGDGKSGA